MWTNQIATRFLGRARSQFRQYKKEVDSLFIHYSSFACFFTSPHSTIYSLALSLSPSYTSMMTDAPAASNFSDREHPDTICLFDVDGTLTPARLVTESP